MRRFADFVSLALLLSASSAVAQLTPLGAEFDASAQAGRHETPTAAVAADGTFRLLWIQPYHGIHQGRFGANDRRLLSGFGLGFGGKAAGDPLLIADQGLPEVYGIGEIRERIEPVMTAPAADGSFWTTWTEVSKYVSIFPLHQSESLLDRDIHGARFAADGRMIGSRITLNSDSVGLQRRSQVVSRPGGGLLALWEDGDNGTPVAEGDVIRGVALDALGSRVAGEQAVSGTLLGRNAAIGVAGGSALAAWEGKIAVGDQYAIWVRALDASTGAPLDIARQVDDGSGPAHKRPTVVALGDDLFLVAWQAYVDDEITTYPGHGLHQTRIVGRLVSTGGEPYGPIFPISGDQFETNAAPRAVSDGAGRAIVAWVTWSNESYPLHVWGAIVDAEAVVSGPTQLTTWKLTPQHEPAIAFANGKLVVGFTGFDERDRQVVGARTFQVD